MTDAQNVQDWATDYDIFDPDFARDPAPVWSDLRQRCPIARSERYGGSWMPTRYEDVCAFARDVETFSSTEVAVVPPPPGLDVSIKAPPITSDPPEHTWARRLILPAFAPHAVAAYEPATRNLCRSLIDGFVAKGRADAAADYAQQVPVRVIAAMMGIDAGMAEEFTEWVRGAIEIGLKDPAVRLEYLERIRGFFWSEVSERKAKPGEDLISYLLDQVVDGEPIPDAHVVGTCNLLLQAGIDTTWSALGSALWHLAVHPEDRARLAADPTLIADAVEELLRAYSPVTMARIVTREITVGGITCHAGDRVLMPFGAANRDPDHFAEADKVIIGRAQNRHLAFGVGIHRCAGSNLARMELRVALEEWLARIPDFQLDDPAAVTWAAGQVRGPRSVPVVFRPA